MDLSEIGDFLDGASLEVSREIAANDPMYRYNPDLYFAAGQQALRCIRLAMLAARQEDVSSILDFACGFGRVQRMLRAAFPDAHITACDVREDGVAFCSRTFGASGVIGRPNPEEVQLQGPFDLIWCGSLLTHVPSDAWRGFVKLFDSVLSPRGLLVFTIYGRHLAEAIRDGSNMLRLNQAQADRLLHDYDTTGFGFVSEATQRAPAFGDFGDCVASREWVMQELDHLPALELLLYLERGWLGQVTVAANRSRQPADASGPSA